MYAAIYCNKWTVTPDPTCHRTQAQQQDLPAHGDWKIAEWEYKIFMRYLSPGIWNWTRYGKVVGSKFQLSVDQLSHTIAYLNDAQNIYTRCLKKNCKKRLLASSCLSVRPSARNNSAPTPRIFIKFGTWTVFSKKIYRENSNVLKSDENKECLMWRLAYIYGNISVNCSSSKKYSRQFYSHCYTVHVVELLNYYTNHCTYIKFIKLYTLKH